MCILTVLPLGLKKKYLHTFVNDAQENFDHDGVVLSRI
jgi:hypothetical protein